MEAQFAKAIDPSKPAANAMLAELATSARAEACACVQNLRKVERFIGLHVPKVEDGNNFGVAIQMETSKMVKEKSSAVSDLLAKLPEYREKRASAWKAVAPSSSTETSETKSSNDDSETKGGEKT